MCEYKGLGRCMQLVQDLLMTIFLGLSNFRGLDLIRYGSGFHFRWQLQQTRVDCFGGCHIRLGVENCHWLLISAVCIGGSHLDGNMWYFLSQNDSALTCPCSCLIADYPFNHSTHLDVSAVVIFCSGITSAYSSIPKQPSLPPRVSNSLGTSISSSLRYLENTTNLEYLLLWSLLLS